MVALTVCSSLGVVFAVEEGDSQTPNPASVSETTPSQPAPEKLRTSKGRIQREKDAEGTQAPNRFDADITFKSQYQYNGRSLEVDTD
jgi:hypothetical protein